ncbi:MAG: hypothetical protein IPM69_05925 [Ignavibacteria bacterium]|nr:hypothetical protein [Ignavibacteria bacterium]
MSLIKNTVSTSKVILQILFTLRMKSFFIILSTFISCTSTLYSQEFTFFGYAQKYESQKINNPQLSGYTGGIFCEFGGDFGKYSSKTIAAKTFSFGWASDVLVGLGSFNSKLAAEISADIFGLTGRYKIDNDNTVGMFYDPIVVFSTPVGGYIGSKVVLKYSYKDIQLNISRGGAGFFYGCIVPKEDGSMHTVELQYWLGEPYFDFVGLRYSSMPFNESKSSGIMLFYGFGIR